MKTTIKLTRSVIEGLISKEFGYGGPGGSPGSITWKIRSKAVKGGDVRDPPVLKHYVYAAILKTTDD